ncbi:uncharacterized protein PRCAT00002832001 [Priceomyces carsonii]|nr:unnamed protein product [Priceomyces carsonii]
MGKGLKDQKKKNCSTAGSNCRPSDNTAQTMRLTLCLLS